MSMDLNLFNQLEFTCHYKSLKKNKSKHLLHQPKDLLLGEPMEPLLEQQLSNIYLYSIYLNGLTHVHKTDGATFVPKTNI